MGATRHIYTNGNEIKGKSKDLVEFLASFITNIEHYDELKNGMFTRDIPSLKNGFNYTSNYKKSNDYLLDASWDKEKKQNFVKLIQIHTGKTIHIWRPSIEKINLKFNQAKKYGVTNSLTKKTTRLLHPYLFSNGSLLFGGSGIYLIDKNSEIIWQSTLNCHHSIEKDGENNFWICGFNTNKKNALKYQIRDDAIQKINPKNGKLLFEKSIFEILIENGFQRSELLINPNITDNETFLDYFHLNDVQPVLNDSKFWKKGDLFISLRHQNRIFLYRPKTNKIIWTTNGPWLRQHDIDILNDHQISFFGNNILDAKFSNSDNSFIDGNNVQYVYDFNKKTISIPYHELFAKNKIRTSTQGLSEIVNNGEIFIEETKKGRLLYGNKNQLLWSYINRVDKKHLSEFNWCRYITEDEFKKFTFVSKK